MPENNKENNVVKRLPTITGIVVSDKMAKTIVVRIDRVARHSVYSKVIKYSKKVKAHDEKNIAKTGDMVKISGTRPLSKEKRWILVEVIKKEK